MLKKLLIANRGEITRRIIRTARRMGVATVAVYSDADRHALHVRDADEAVHIGPSPATESYLDIAKIIAAAKATGADAVHPGYGFLSENADFSDACATAGLAFVGPRGKAMRGLGGKAAAKEIAIKAGVPVVPGYQGKAQDLATLTREARRIGYPVMIKAVAGGGGRGMRLVEREADLEELLESARREAAAAFGNPDCLLEKVVVRPRHVEVQVFGDNHGNVVHLFERDCTLQRRNQKVVEEAPAPGMGKALRAKVCDAAVTLAKSVGYQGAGTVEFLVEGGALSDDAPWYFIEMNTRLQVEHPVTEAITGLDLVEWQLRVAAGERLPLKQEAIRMQGCAVEVRLCAEDPAAGFMPSVGRITVFDAAGLDPAIRLETGVAAGSEVSPFYDSMIAKLIAAGADRDAVLDRLQMALSDLLVAGVTTNARFLYNLLAHPHTRALSLDTGTIGREMAGLADVGVSEAAREHAAASFLAHESGRHAVRATAWSGDPWSRADGFALDGGQARVTTLVVDGATVRPSVRWHAGIGSENAPTAVIDAAGAAGGRRGAPAEPPHVRVTDDGAYGFDRGRTFELGWPRHVPDAVEEAGDGTVVRAPINGRIARIFVAAGDAVSKGQRIAVVEAMKMEHVLAAATDGRVERLDFAEGAQVTQGAIIASLTPA